jgi:sulfate adenylyltransferase
VVAESVHVSGAHPPTVRTGPEALAHAELLLAGLYGPLRGFLSRADHDSVVARRRLADGTPWPVPVLLTVPSEVAAAAVDAGLLLLEDDEGHRRAQVRVSETWQTSDGTAVAGEVVPAAAENRLPATHDAAPVGPGQGAVLAVATDRPLLTADVRGVADAAEQMNARVLLLGRVASPGELRLSPDALMTALAAALGMFPVGSTVRPVPLRRDPDAQRDLLLQAHVAAAAGATAVLAVDSAGDTMPDPAELPLPVLLPPVAAADRSVARVAELLDIGAPLPPSLVPPAVATVLREHVLPLHQRGFTVLLTGFSGSGKSTIARALAPALVARGRPRVTLLDGDVVRTLLSAGLTFSRADRHLNVLRLGFVAAEVTRHGGVCVCAPIAPFAATRAEVRRMVEAVGGFALVHVATPLAECERRDVKGLYARARAGEIPAFTGISDPYEAPVDADLVLDTTTTTVTEAVEHILDVLASRGWVRPRTDASGGVAAQG